jgi:chromosome segregation ATPase
VSNSSDTFQKERETFNLTLKQRTEQITKLSADNQSLQTKVAELEERLSTARTAKDQVANQVKDLVKKIDSTEEQHEATKKQKAELEVPYLQYYCVIL